ncbi:MAG: DUF1499 domain-containing protein [Aquamicrobium sp.]|uniref:DUF1499 domain-containing protein n=1 Tax=Aquamicrobium sp. TaxID=1872579 RepID=UPI00349E7FEC|nr:DUF1499 domain-containing protein [Aquamicrobium sp.]
MAAFPQRRVSKTAGWARRLSAFSLVLLVTVGVGHRYGLVETFGFLWTLVLVAVLALAGLFLAVGGFSQLWRNGDKAGKASLAATVLSLIVLAPYAVAGWLYLTLPALTDVSTDLDEPPAFVIAPRLRTAQMNVIGPVTAEAAALQMRTYPDVAGRRLDASVERVLAALAPVVAARGWRVHGPMPTSAGGRTEISIEMEAPSLLLRFPADAVLRLTDEEETTFVDMRMASRYGPHDLGSNARRINGFMAALAAELERQSLEIIDIPPSDGNENTVD